MKKRNIRTIFRAASCAVKKELFTRKIHKYNGIPYRKRIIPYHPNGEGNVKIKELLSSGKPAMITRYGHTELDTIERFLLQPVYFGKKKQAEALCICSGFFPNDKKLISRFVELYATSARHIDIVACWNSLNGRTAEEKLIKKWSSNATLTNLASLEPWWYLEPWSEYLQDKKVLVIHPFEKSIRYQYENNREKLFLHPKVLPLFRSLQIIRPTQGVGMSSTDGYATWFDAYEALCRKIEAADFDIAIIGAGAYGLPLAAFVKIQGKQAVHMGGATQSLFGIKGNRWELPFFTYQHKLYNSWWKRPYPEEMPKNLFYEYGKAPYW
jgi:hypothetical protein